ncbi:GNAT family N-acetyltransferase [Roseococcus sp. YIM B11640]|uniref:GNAT family N-acetyltransferase n=1 Tax=Roseococcus sp. YIM B11640 TaxID=3133973 RepID=UPI003C7ACF08
MTGFIIRPAEEMETVARLFREYAAGLDVDLAYQGFEAELAALPGKYAPPAGRLLLAHGEDGEALGCIALRPLPEAGCCEMKRLYVRPAGRGLGLGAALVEALAGEARTAGHRELRLDTLPSMTAAIALYRRLGFEPMAPYYETPVAGTVFLRLIL